MDMHGRYAELSDLPRGARVVLAMSGGVDSAVSAVRLRRAGAEVVGLTMKNWCYGETADTGRSCCSLEAIDDARAVCDRLGIRHLVVDTETRFTRSVIDDFVAEYARGRTPTPCVRCNRIVRFDTLAEWAARLDANFVATGHYARVFVRDDGARLVARPVHRAKDQSYFLAGLTPAQLERVVFPLGDLDKPRVRELAREAGLPVADKPESQEVCFVAGGSLRDFLDGRVPTHPGPVVTMDGRVVGRHDGLAAFTVGQRRGLGVALGEPAYVVDVDRERNALVVGPAEALERRGLVCRLVFADASLAAPGVSAQIRSRHLAAPVRGVECDGERARVVFERAQRAVAPGQTVAFYRGDVVVGAGVIDEALT